MTHHYSGLPIMIRASFLALSERLLKGLIHLALPHPYVTTMLARFTTSSLWRPFLMKQETSLPPPKPSFPQSLHLRPKPPYLLGAQRFRHFPSGLRYFRSYHYLHERDSSLHERGRYGWHI